MNGLLSNPQFVSVPVGAATPILIANPKRKGINFALGAGGAVFWVWCDDSVNNNRGISLTGTNAILTLLDSTWGDIVARSWFAINLGFAVVDLGVSELFDSPNIEEINTNVFTKSSESISRGDIKCYSASKQGADRIIYSPVNCRSILNRLRETRRSK